MDEISFSYSLHSLNLPANVQWMHPRPTAASLFPLSKSKLLFTYKHYFNFFIIGVIFSSEGLKTFSLRQRAVAPLIKENAGHLGNHQFSIYAKQ